jgi:hypothetical protein
VNVLLAEGDKVKNKLAEQKLEELQIGLVKEIKKKEMV